VTIDDVRVEISRALTMPMKDIIIGRVNNGRYSYILKLREKGNWETVAHERSAALCWVAYQRQDLQSKCVRDFENVNRAPNSIDSRPSIEPAVMSNSLSSYPTPWEGSLILACRKCQKKLKGNRILKSLAKLQDSIERLNKLHSRSPFHIVSVACMDLCPKGGVAICNTAWRTDRLLILYGEEDIEDIYDTQ
jgi:hypothetical protein